MKAAARDRVKDTEDFVPEITAAAQTAYERKMSKWDHKTLRQYEKDMDVWSYHRRQLIKHRHTRADGAITPHQLKRGYSDEEPLIETAPPSSPKRPEPPGPRMFPGDPDLFLRLSTPLSIMLAQTITKTRLDESYSMLTSNRVGFRNASLSFTTCINKILIPNFRCMVNHISSPAIILPHMCMIKFWTMVQRTASGHFFKSS